jgi:hypothetical protein
MDMVCLVERERERERERPEMESTKSPLMKSLVNFMVGTLNKESVLPLQWLVVVIFPLWSSELLLCLRSELYAPLLYKNHFSHLYMYCIDSDPTLWSKDQRCRKGQRPTYEVVHDIYYIALLDYDPPKLFVWTWENSVR